MMGPEWREGRRIAIFRIRGDLAAQDVSDSLPHGVEVCLAQERPGLVFDLQALTFIDSSGLALLVRTWRQARERGGELVVIHPGPVVVKILRFVGITDLRVFDDDESAIRYLADRGEGGAGRLAPLRPRRPTGSAGAAAEPPAPEDG